MRLFCSILFGNVFLFYSSCCWVSSSSLFFSVHGCDWYVMQWRKCCAKSKICSKMVDHNKPQWPLRYIIFCKTAHVKHMLSVLSFPVRQQRFPHFCDHWEISSYPGTFFFLNLRVLSNRNRQDKKTSFLMWERRLGELHRLLCPLLFSDMSQAERGLSHSNRPPCT